MSNDTQPLLGLRILLVEDESDIAELLSFVLQNAGDEDRDMASAAGFQRHIKKPIDVDTLLDIVVEVISEEKCYETIKGDRP